MYKLSKLSNLYQQEHYKLITLLEAERVRVSTKGSAEAEGQWNCEAQRGESKAQQNLVTDKAWLPKQSSEGEPEKRCRRLKYILEEGCRGTKLLKSAVGKKEDAKGSKAKRDGDVKMDAQAEPPFYTRSPSPSNYLSILPPLHLCLFSFLYLYFAPITSTLTPLYRTTLPLLYSLDSPNLHILYLYYPFPHISISNLRMVAQWLVCTSSTLHFNLCSQVLLKIIRGTLIIDINYILYYNN